MIKYWFLLSLASWTLFGYAASVQFDYKQLLEVYIQKCYQRVNEAQGKYYQGGHAGRKKSRLKIKEEKGELEAAIALRDRLMQPQRQAKQLGIKRRRIQW